MPPLKKKRKKKSKVYFGTPVHDAIVRYNRSDNPFDRNKIYTEEIHTAFLKLAENIINTFKFSYFSYGFRDLQEEVVSNLVINMHKFDETKGSKAFSYFSVVAKNYLILNNNANYKKLKIHDDVDTLYDHGIDDEVIEKSPSVEVFKKTLTYFENHLETIYEMETYYGDETLYAILRHAKAMADFLSGFTDIYELAEELPEQTEEEREEYYDRKEADTFGAKAQEEKKKTTKKVVFHSGTWGRDSWICRDKLYKQKNRALC